MHKTDNRPYNTPWQVWGPNEVVLGGWGLATVSMNSGNHHNLKKHLCMIEAAPDMLQACEQALQFIKNHWPQEHGQPDVGHTWASLDNAINKAKGA